MKRLILVLAASAFVFSSCQEQSTSMINAAHANYKPAPAQEEVWLESLITETPQEGRELAIKMARKTIGAIQGDADVKKKVRSVYAEDAAHLMMAAEVVAIEFQTVAAANNYWRK